MAASPTNDTYAPRGGVRLTLHVRRSISLVGVPLALCGCGGGTGGPAGGDVGGAQPPPGPHVWYRPTVETTWQWQLQPGADGRINTGYDVDVYDIDLFDSDPAVVAGLQASGRNVICYFSAGSFEDFRSDAGAFLAEELGNPLEGFPDERWLDIRSDNVRRIMLLRLDLAVQKACDGVEPDNMTGFANDTGFDLTADDQLAYNRFIADAAHERGLAVGLKNDLDQVVDLVDSFDFSVNEQCHEFDECDLLLPFIDAGKPVFNAEYDTRFITDEHLRSGMCADALALGLRTLVLPVALDDSVRFSCDR
ncbi:MAG: endo alpha-1,4 polygalactosaminidase [Phycisphaerae bacterium]